jgi:hypothetical protein
MDRLPCCSLRHALLLVQTSAVAAAYLRPLSLSLLRLRSRSLLRDLQHSTQHTHAQFKSSKQSMTTALSSIEQSSTLLIPLLRKLAVQLHDDDAFPAQCTQVEQARRELRVCAL